MTLRLGGHCPHSSSVSDYSVQEISCENLWSGSAMVVRVLLLIFAIFPTFALADVESLFVNSTDKIISAQVELLFEEKKINDEGIETMGAPKVEARESEISLLAKDRWEIRIHLQEGDRIRRPLITAVLSTESGELIALPNRSLDVSEPPLPGALTCLREPTVLSAQEILALSPQERVAFIRGREDDAALFAAEVDAMLSSGLAKRIFTEERKRGLAPKAPMNKTMTVEEISRRLVALESVWAE